MKLKPFVLAATLVAPGATSFATPTQAKEQFIPLLSYRTGAYAPNGVPWANGKQDYLKLHQCPRRRHQRRQDHLRRM